MNGTAPNTRFVTQSLFKLTHQGVKQLHWVTPLNQMVTRFAGRE
jgi:hypothetical protein